MLFYRQTRILKLVIGFVALIVVIKVLLGVKGPENISNSMSSLSLPEKMAFVHAGSQEKTIGEHTPHKTENVAVKEYFIDTKQFAASCNPDDLFEVKRQEQMSTSVAVPTANQALCPRVIPASVSGLPLTGLLSFPGAGSTWIRHILQEMTGLPTGSIYDDTSLRSNGFPSEGQVENVLAVKSHVMSKSQPKFIPVKKFDRIIILLRNVYDSFLAEYKRNRLTRSHTADRYINTSHPSWGDFMQKAGYRWKTFMLDSFDFDGPMLVVFYEDLKSQLLPQIIRLAEFLQSDKLKEFSFCCVVKEREGHFHRKSSTQKAVDIFSESQKGDVNSKIRYVVKKLTGKHREVADRLNSFIMP